VDGILASMTVALAVQKGCSLVELHAGMAEHVHTKHEPKYSHFIHDVFWVVQRSNGLPFANEELHDLATCLLAAAQSPMRVVTGRHGTDSSQQQEELQDYLQRENVPVPSEQITVIPSISSSSCSRAK
jgi:hypothetical protein